MPRCAGVCCQVQRQHWRRSTWRAHNAACAVCGIAARFRFCLHFFCPSAVSHSYAIVGLTPEEKSLLNLLLSSGESGFASTTGLMRMADPSQVDLLIADGDEPVEVERLRRVNPLALIVLVGRPPAEYPELAELPCVPRPMSLEDAVAVLGALEGPDEAPTFIGTRTMAAGVSAEDEGQALSARSAWATSEFATQDAEAAEARQARRMAPVQVLIMRFPYNSAREDSTLLYSVRLLGCNALEVSDIRDAITLLAREPVRCVFLDQSSLGREVLPIVRALKAWASAAGSNLGVIVIARRGWGMERLRARMAGCVWLLAPIRLEQLAATLRAHGLNPVEGVK